MVSSTIGLGYTLYGSVAIASVVMPALLVYLLGIDTPFPTFNATLKVLDTRVHPLALAINNVTRLTRLR